MLGLSGDDCTAIELSLRIAVVATLASFPFGIFVGYGLARWEFPGKSLVKASSKTYPVTTASCTCRSCCRPL